MDEPLLRRDHPATEDQDLSLRSLSVRAQTVNEEDRSVEAVISTENAVEVYDWRIGERIDEVLLASGADLPRQMPLLNTHARWSLNDVLGSVRDIRVEEPAGGVAQIVGRLYFTRDDPDADKAWNKVRQGHLTDLSVGYRVAESVEIAQGQSATVAGREFRATKKRLRVATSWAPKETSVVPIGADAAAKTRGRTNRSYNTMDEIRKYLQSIGLDPNATDEDLREFWGKLDGDQRVEVDKLAEAAGVDPPEPAREKPPTPPMSDNNRNDPPPVNQSAEADRIAQQAVAAERERVRNLRQLAGDDVPEDVLQRCIDEGLTVERSQGIFLQALRENRTPGVGPGIHAYDHAQDCNERALGLALVMRQDGDIEAWARRNRVRNWEQLADQAERFRSWSLMDITREAARIATGRIPSDREEMFRSAVSGGTLSGIFTTSVNATLLQAWEEEADTTVGWCEEVDVADFKTQTAVDYEGRTGLEKLPRGGTANHMAPSDSSITYAIARYAKKFTVDEQDIIDDSLDALTRMPADMGAAARRLRPDLVYALLLANPTMGDTGALFNNTALTTAGGHSNLGTAALAAAALQAGIVSMSNQYIGSGRNKIALNIRPRYLIVPQDLVFTARNLVESSMLVVAGTSDVEKGNANTLAGLLEVRADGRLGAAGVTDPSSGTAYTGSTTNWFLAATPGKTIRAAYLRGSGRRPMVRSYTLTEGQWGVGWDIKMDVGVKEMGYAGLYKSTGAG